MQIAMVTETYPPEVNGVAVAFSIVAVFYFPALVWLVLPFSVLVALSRPILGLHYPSDVLAGASIGAALASFSLALA